MACVCNCKTVQTVLLSQRDGIQNREFCAFATIVIPRFTRFIFRQRPLSITTVTFEQYSVYVCIYSRLFSMLLLHSRASWGSRYCPISAKRYITHTNGAFCDTAILFLKKIALVKFSNEPGSEPLLAWKRASWVQETCSLIQAAVLRTASRLFHRGLRECFEKDYEHLFDVPQHFRTDNNVSGLSPIYIPVTG